MVLDLEDALTPFTYNTSWKYLSICKFEAEMISRRAGGSSGEAFGTYHFPVLDANLKPVAGGNEAFIYEEWLKSKSDIDCIKINDDKAFDNLMLNDLAETWPNHRQKINALLRSWSQVDKVVARTRPIVILNFHPDGRNWFGCFVMLLMRLGSTMGLLASLILQIASLPRKWLFTCQQDAPIRAEFADYATLMMLILPASMHFLAKSFFVAYFGCAIVLVFLVKLSKVTNGGTLSSKDYNERISAFLRRIVSEDKLHRVILAETDDQTCAHKRDLDFRMQLVMFAGQVINLKEHVRHNLTRPTKKVGDKFRGWSGGFEFSHYWLTRGKGMKLLEDLNAPKSYSTLWPDKPDEFFDHDAHPKCLQLCEHVKTRESWDLLLTTSRIPLKGDTRYLDLDRMEVPGRPNRGGRSIDIPASRLEFRSKWDWFYFLLISFTFVTVVGKADDVDSTQIDHIV